MEPPAHPFSETPHGGHVSTNGSRMALLLVGAGQTYLEQRNADAALECASQALMLIEAGTDRADLGAALSLQGSAYHLRGHREQAEAAWLRARVVQEENGDLFGIAETCCHLAGIAKERGDLHGAESLLRESLRCSSSGVPGPVRARALEDICPLLRRMGQPEAALSSLSEALRIREALGDTKQVAVNHDHLGNIHLACGQLTDAIRHYQCCLDLFERAGNRSGSALVYNNLGIAQMHRGEYAASTRSFERARTLFAELGDPRRRAWSVGNLGLLTAYQGNVVEAEKLLHECLRELEQVEDRSGQAIFMNNLAPVCRMAGRFSDAIAWANRSLAAMKELGQVEGLTQPWLNLALSYLEMGRIADARLAAEQVRALAESSRFVGVKSEAKIVEAMIALHARDWAESERLAREALALAEDGDCPRQKGEALRVQGESLLGGGRLEQARASLLASQKVFRQLNDVYQLALCRLALGDLFCRAGAEEAAATHLRQAAEVFGRIGHVDLKWRALTQLARAEWVLSREQSRTTLADAAELAWVHRRTELLEATHGIRDELEAMLQPPALENTHRDLSRLHAAIHESDGVAALCQRVVDFVREDLGLRDVTLELDGPPRDRFGSDRVNLLAPEMRVLGQIARHTREAQFRQDSSNPAECQAAIPVIAIPNQCLGMFLVRGDAGAHESSEPPGWVRELAHVALLLGLAIQAGGTVFVADETTPTDPSQNAPPMFEGLVGSSSPMRRLFATLTRVSISDATVFITGESGTGKELVARAIHRRSDRKDGPFVAISCPSIPRELIESELFGVEKGAFTGATASRPGQFELADGGTLFLDEIGDMDLATQTKVLRFLQEREFCRVGGRGPIRVDIRLVAATSRDIESEIKSGRFRQDLYYRINVVPLELPPLRERRSDIPALISHFATQVGRRAGRGPLEFTAEAEQRLVAYTWPGNVRELRNVIESLVAMNHGSTITEELLPARIRKAPSGGDAQVGRSALRPGETLATRIMAVEGAIIRTTLEDCAWNQSRAARLLGLKESTMRYKMRQYGIRRRTPLSADSGSDRCWGEHDGNDVDTERDENGRSFRASENEHDDDRSAFGTNGVASTSSIDPDRAGPPERTDTRHGGGSNGPRRDADRGGDLSQRDHHATGIPSQS